jgi:hypothetical protein
MRSRHPDLEVIGLTESTDLKAIEAFRSDTGAAYPMVYGLTTTSKEAYGVAKAPSLRVVDRKGRRAGDDLESLERALGP